MKTAILGATGYTALVLARLLSEHPEVEEILCVSSSQPGTDIRSVDPGLSAAVTAKMASTGGRMISMEDALRRAASGGVDAVFSALPHVKSAELCSAFCGKSVVIDLSADFRFEDAALYESVYKTVHPRKDLLANAVYGFPEWYRDRIAKADLIAQPGCYPTCTLLPLLPLAVKGMLRGTVVANAISGISGAGKKEKAEYLYTERTENTGAYNPGTAHRHHPEIQKELHKADAGLSILFFPHLAPLKRGMCVTTVAELKKPASEDEIGGLLTASYGACRFVSLNGKRIPQTRDVWGSNRIDIGWKVEGDRVMLFSALDNLGKGASGNALQCMNIRFGFDEAAGLRTNGEF